VENSSNIQKLLSSMTDITKTHVISCDIFSHNILSQLKIDHEKIENYIHENDQNLIDKLIIETSHEWYKQKGISELLKFENLNLGSLLELEIAPYFLQIMKNFIGVKRVIDEENPSIVISSTSLTQMVKTVTSNKNIKMVSYDLPNAPTLSYDRIALSINVGKKLFTIWVSRDFALKIKNTLESITSLIFKFKYNFSNPTRRKSILLLDFNPMLYGDLLKELTKLDENILLLNQRRPAVWNLQSLNNVKRSNSKIIKLEDLLNSKLSSVIIQKQKELQKRLQKMSFEDDVLTKFFSIEGYSFWPSIKNSFIEMCSKRFNEAITRFVLSRELFKKMNISCMLILYDAAPEEKMIIHVAKEFEIPGIILQHGILTKRDTGILTSILPFVPPIGIKHGLWGKESENLFCQMSVKNEDMILVGNPRYDELFRMKNKSSNKSIILVGSSILPELAYSRIDTNEMIKFENVFRDICRISVNVPNKKLIVKLHPNQYASSYDVKPILNEIDPSIPIYRTGNITDLMKDCDVLVYIGYSTVLLEAMILNKPTITFKIGPDWDYEHKIFQSGATLMVETIDEFEEALNNVLFNEVFRNDLIQKGEKYINDYFINQGNSSKFLTNILKKY
jgi:glycosyltransferase involved in cell wall biosynthesis